MVTVHPQYVVDATQTRTAAASEWEEILEALEDLDDIRAYDMAKAEGQEAVPFAQALREIELENRQ